MRLKNTGIAAVLVVGTLITPGGGLTFVTAQSLADVARQEQERRHAIKAPSKVLTNKDLRAVPVIDTPASAAPDPAADHNTSPEAGKDPTKTEDAAKPEAAKDQAYWSSRWKELQGQLARNETFVIALQSRVNALANEYTNESDGVRQAAIGVERQKATDDLNSLKKEIEDNKKAVATLQEDARRAGVPPGWLR